MSWEEWTHRILELLELPPTSNIAVEALHRPWLLVPREGELTDEEMEELFASVRHRLLMGLKMPVTGAPLRTRLEALNPIESLPLLFAIPRLCPNVIH